MTTVADGERSERLRGWHTEMSRLRAFEEAVAEGHAADELPGLLHLSMGGEAVVTATVACMGDADRLFSTHRPHAHFIAAGVEERDVMAELAGKETGLCHGRAGTMHLMADRAVMATGIVGGTLPIALGYATTLPEDAIAVCFFGDGAVQTGVFHEAMNLAALWKAPVLFVCENNGWAEFSSREEHTTVGNVVRYGELYRIPSAEVDGSDVEAVHQACEELSGPVREGAGPALLECHIARLRSHYEGDWREQRSEGDPLLAIERTLVELGTDAEELGGTRSERLEAARALLRSVLDEEPAADPSRDAGMVFAKAIA
ncbi:MAG: thiamine pyrophosphate-dependent dehydrogenase E1 component subunit alpha [Solirubrobacteraceae bacterium]